MGQKGISIKFASKTHFFVNLLDKKEKAVN
jgi:hypothetical protein